MLKYETPELHFARCATVTYNVSQITYLVVLLCTSIFKSEVYGLRNNEVFNFPAGFVLFIQMFPHHLIFEVEYLYLFSF